MEPWEDNEERIERYLEGKMSLVEEETFMHELNANEELRKQYENELLISALLDDVTEENNEIKLPYTNKNIDNDIAKKKEKNTSTSVFIGEYSSYIAAVTVVIAGIVIFFVVKTQHPAQQKASVTDKNRKHPSIFSIDSLNQQPASNTHTALYTSALYRKFYAPYVAKNNPVEISAYYNDYKQKNYNKVLAASEKDYQVMGVNANQQTLTNYMHLYKGLCYLEKEEPDNAVQQFDSILKKVANTSSFYEAEWYKALSYVKLNQTDSATNVLSAILQTHSSYKKQAEQLLTELKQTK